MTLPPIAFMGGVAPGAVRNRICVINPDGSGFAEIGPANPWYAAIWINTTQLLAIQNGGSESLYVVEADGSFAPLRDAPGIWGGVKMSLSPDGTRAAGAAHQPFVGPGGSAPGVTVVEVPGGGPVTYIKVDDDLIDIAGFESGACVAWSPDGSQFAYQSYFDAGPNSNAAVKVCNVDGTGINTILLDSVNDVQWSVMDWWPDGSALLVSSADYRFGLTRIIKCAPDGSDQRVLFTDSDGSLFGFANPVMALSADGSTVVFPTFLEGALYTVPTDGSGVRTQIYPYASALLGAPSWRRDRSSAAVVGSASIGAVMMGVV